jgi:hypothetical protein
MLIGIFTSKKMPIGIFFFVGHISRADHADRRTCRKTRMKDGANVMTKLRIEAPGDRLSEAMPALIRFILDHREASITVRRCAGSGDVLIDGAAGSAE